MNTNIKEHSEEIYKEIINANVDELITVKELVDLFINVMVDGVF